MSIPRFFLTAPLAAVAVAMALAAPGRAQDASVQELKAQVDRQAKELQELKNALKQLQQPAPGKVIPTAALGQPAAPDAPGTSPDDLKKFIGDYLLEKQSLDDAAKKEKLATEGVRVGSVLGPVSAEFKNGNYLWLSTPNGDFTMHPGAWVQYDNVWFNQSEALLTPAGKFTASKKGPVSGVPSGGIGELDDGTYFRRIFPFVEGTLFDVFEYRFNLQLSNLQYSSVGLDEFWIGENKIPFIGSIRVGHIKTAQGFEADMTGSSRTMTFLERSSYSEAIELNQNFYTGLLAHNAYFDDRMTSTVAIFRQDVGTNSGAQFGDGQFGVQGRLTALPIWEGNGRSWLHLGLSGGWRNGNNNATGANGATAENPRTFSLSARDELRDDDPAGGPAGTQVLPNANDTRMITTGTIVARNQYLTGSEFCYVRGPFSLQGEYGLNSIDGATGIGAAGNNAITKLKSPTNYIFSGGYIQAAYTLTGESRAYNKYEGILARQYFGDRGPFTNAWFVRDENGHLNWGLGAWEIAARYSYTNLNDGSGASRIQGGVMTGLSLGLNWYLNANMECMFDYVINQRYEVPVGANEGQVRGFGIRAMLSF